MSPRLSRLNGLSIASLAFALFGMIASPAGAQLSNPTITAVSNGSAGTAIQGDDTVSLELGESFNTAAELDVMADRQLLLYAGGESGGNLSGGMVVILGPARVSIHQEDNDWVITVKSGRVMTSAAGEQADQLLILQAGAEDSPGAVRLPIGQGQTDLVVNEGVIEVGFSGQGNLDLSVGGGDRQLSSGKRLTIRGSDVSEGELSSWRADNGLDFEEVSLQLMLRSATDARVKVQYDLVNNVVSWDRYAKAENIQPQPRPETAEPEIRQVVTSVQTNLQSGSNRGGTAETPNVQGANEVPSLSPGSVSVGGITAVEVNNARAGSLLTTTQSRGLGFRGPSQLASPGFLGGRRTVGPPGLGAQNRGN